MPKNKNLFGYFFLDPGTTTGVCHGTVDFSKRGLSVGELMLARGDMVVEEYKVRPTDQLQLSEVPVAVDMGQEFISMFDHWRSMGIDPHKNIVLGFEDFNLRGGATGSLDRTGVSPIRITSAFLGHIWGIRCQFVFQQPEQAKSRWTSPRLKEAGLWTVGRQHGRDATRHAATWVAKMSQSKL